MNDDASTRVPVGSMVARLDVLRVMLAPHYPEHHATVSDVQRALAAESDSRRMFIARLKMLQENGKNVVTIAHVLGLLDDCDMLAQRITSDASPNPTTGSSRRSD